MAQELFQAVRTAEETADQIVQDAQLKARELIKAVEAEIKADDRKAALSQRAQYHTILENKRLAVEKRLEEQRPLVHKAQQESLNAARQKLNQVSQMIIERVWNDGNR
jgi:vacuolar-type H+-ATPase subunit H